MTVDSYSPGALIGVEQISAEWGSRSRRAVLDPARHGPPPSAKIGGRRLFRREDVEAWEVEIRGRCGVSDRTALVKEAVGNRIFISCVAT